MKRLILAGAAALAMLGSTAAMARVDVGISIGIPGIFYSAPQYYYPPVRHIHRPPVIIVPQHRYRPARVRPHAYRNGYRDGWHDKKHNQHRNGHKGRGHRH